MKKGGFKSIELTAEEPDEE